MARHYFNWVDAPTLGVFPDELTQRWASSSWQIQGLSGDRYLQHFGVSGAFFAASIDPAGNVDDVEIVVWGLLTNSAFGTTGDRHALFARASGEAGSETAYMLILSGQTVQIRKQIAGSSTTLATASFSWAQNAWQAMRFRVQGTALKGKAWAQADPEPSGWTVETTDSDITDPGWVGFGGYRGASYRWRMAGVGTGGDTAPTEEPAGGVESGWGSTAWGTTPWGVDQRTGGSTANATVTATGDGSKTSRNGAEAALTAAGSGQGAKHAADGETAAATAASDGSGHKIATGGSAATATATTTGGGTKIEPGRGGSTAHATADTTGDGRKVASGGALAPLVVTATGGGRAEITVPSGGAVAELVATSEGAGLKIATGGAAANLTVRATGGGRNPARVIEFTDVIRVPARPDSPTVPARPVIRVPSRTRS